MSNLEGFQKARVYLADLYRDKAAMLAQAVTANPAGDHRGAFTACQIAWGALVDIENAIRAEVFAGDVIDDYYRQQDATEGESSEDR